MKARKPRPGRHHPAKTFKPNKIVKKSAHPQKHTNRGNGTRSQSKHKQTEPIYLPFEPKDNILLIGEGDFSYSHAITSTPNLLHPSTRITATCYEKSPEDLYAKYPQSKSYIDTLANAGHRVLFNIDATRLAPKFQKTYKNAFDSIVFNFPHTGGLTTDVDRQIRANQELLLKFFTNAHTLLKTGGSVAVSLFDGKPYDEWDVKRLARRSEGQFVVRRSWVFDAAVFVGYKHARTIGNREKAEWKGEERRARTFLFERAGDKRRKGKKVDERKEESSEGDEEDDWGEEDGEDVNEDGQDGQSGIEEHVENVAGPENSSEFGDDGQEWLGIESSDSDQDTNKNNA